MNTQAEKNFVAPGRAIAAQPRGPVRLRFTEEGDGNTHLEIGVDYGKADVPDRRYYADFCNVVGARSGITFIFGRLAPGEETLRTQVEISFAETMFISQLWTSSRSFHQKLRDELSAKSLPSLGKIIDSDKIQGFRANNVFMSRVGDDSVLDFYYIAAPDIHFVRTGRRSDVDLEPIIRIALPTLLTLDFLDQCAPHAERLGYVAKENADEA